MKNPHTREVDDALDLSVAERSKGFVGALAGRMDWVKWEYRTVGPKFHVEVCGNESQPPRGTSHRRRDVPSRARDVNVSVSRERFKDHRARCSESFVRAGRLLELDWRCRVAARRWPV